jgi:hypothetical protein
VIGAMTSLIGPMTKTCSEGNLFDRPTRHAYSVKTLARQFHAKLARVRLFLRGALDAERTRELSEQMHAARPCERQCHKILSRRL